MTYLKGNLTCLRSLRGVKGSACTASRKSYCWKWLPGHHRKPWQRRGIADESVDSETDTAEAGSPRIGPHSLETDTSVQLLPAATSDTASGWSTWQQGYLPLVVVSLLWGSYTPSIRYMYSLDPSVSPQVLTAYRTALSAILLLAATFINALSAQQRRRSHAYRGAEGTYSDGHKISPSSSSSNSSNSSHRPAASPSQGSPADVLICGLELGLYNFLGTATQALGLEFTSASKAAFLAQMTAALTPCFAWAFRQTVLPRHWIACGIALLGSCMISLDGIQEDSLMPPPPPPHHAPIEATVTTVPSASAVRAGITSIAAPALSEPVEAAADGAQEPVQERSAAAAVALLWDRTMLSREEALVVTDTSCSPSSSCSSNSSSSGPITPYRRSDLGVLSNPSRLSSSSEEEKVLRYVALPEGSSSGSRGNSSSRNNFIDGASERGSSSIRGSSRGAVAAETMPAAAAAAAAAGGVVNPAFTLASAKPDLLSSLLPAVRGELYIFAACCCYALATVRLSMVAGRHDAVQLATAKTLVLAAASAAWLLLPVVQESFLGSNSSSTSSLSTTVSSSSSAMLEMGSAVQQQVPSNQEVQAVAAERVNFQAPPIMAAREIPGEGPSPGFSASSEPGSGYRKQQQKQQQGADAAEAAKALGLVPSPAPLPAGATATTELPVATGTAESPGAAAATELPVAAGTAESPGAAATTELPVAAAADLSVQQTQPQQGWSSHLQLQLSHASAAWQLPASLSAGTGLLVLLYSSWGCGALSAVLQTKGQAHVTAASAQVGGEGYDGQEEGRGLGHSPDGLLSSRVV